METPDTPTEAWAVTRRSLLVTVIALVAFVGFGAGWLLNSDDETEQEQTVVDPEVRQLHEDWFADWNAADGEAVEARMTLDGRHYCPLSGADGVGGEELVAFVERGWQMTDAEIVSVTRTATLAGPNAGSDDYVVVTEFTLDEHAGYTSVLHLRTVGGELRIHEHHAYP